ncbi:hypothetical protein NLU13_5146 [Sarocladium strictum]|uniref:Uncharacterized protein n=1 Tax=Sarocladium strictum TaxID=5046 RepID=A0AA39GHL8_SARSR|nr:hypothetical protein NLU13_5146 [Sarocladium strictum]
MTRPVALFTALVALVQTTSAEPRPPPGRPDREQSHPCFPGSKDTVGGNSDESLPPCFRQAEIMEACGVGNENGNLTSSEMKQCVCDGSFFYDTVGCGACLSYQDLISEDQYNEGKAVVSSVSSAYCRAGATAGLNSILNTIGASSTTAGLWTIGELPSMAKPTAVSNYYTATADRLGPGLESLVTDRTLTGEAPTAEPTDDAAATLSGMGFFTNIYYLFGVVAALLMS